MISTIYNPEMAEIWTDDKNMIVGFLLLNLLQMKLGPTWSYSEDVEKLKKKLNLTLNAFRKSKPLLTMT